jgi:hypothetical protein
MIQTHGIDRDDTRSDLARDLLQRLETARAGIGPDLSAGGQRFFLS